MGEDTTQTNRVRTAFINATKAEVKIKITNANFIIRTANSYSSNDIGSHVAQVLPASTLSEYILSQGFWYRVVLCKADISANITHNEVESYIEMSSSDSIDGKIKGLETDITNVRSYFNSLIFNVNQYDNDFSTRYTLETAVAKVPTTLRKCGMMVTFRTNLSTGKFETYQYRLSSVSDGYFLDKANWVNIGVYDKNIFNVNQYIGNYTNFLTIETATTNVPTEFRTAGMLILYRVSSSKWEIAQYSRPDTSDKYWTDLANWEIINKEDGSINGYVQGSYDASNGTFYDNVKDAVSTKSIVINGGNVELITKTGFVMRGAFLTKQDGTYLQKLWSSENKTTYTFEYPDVALLYVIIKKEDGANVTPDECLGKLTVIGAVNDFDNSLERSLFGYKEKHSASTQWQQGAINTGTGEPVSMTTRISTGFLKGGVNVICKNELSIRSIVKYPSNTSYKDYEVVQNGVSLKDFVTPNDGFFYIFVIWDGNNGNLTVADAANIELFESDNLEGSVNRLSNNVETLLNGNVIKRAKWLALGDSITEGYYSKSDGSFVLDSQKGWAHHVSEINNYKLTNKGIGGSGFVRVATNDRPYNAVQLIDMLDLSDYNLVTIAWGVNDWKYNMALGTWEESTPKDGTIFGNMKYVVEKIISSNPLAKIVMITPINCKQGDESTNWGIGHAYPNNGTLEDIFNAIKRCCEYYCIELIDMTHTSIVNRKNIGSLLFDNVHPSELAHIMMARELSRKINCF